MDCVNLAAGIYRALGLIQDFHPPDYRLDGGRSLVRSQLLDYIEGTGLFTLVSEPGTARPDTDAIQPGDLLTFRWHRVAHHVGVATVGTHFVQALEGAGVIESDIDDPTHRRRLVRIYRPMEAKV